MTIIFRGLSDKDLGIFLNKILKKPEVLKEFIDKKGEYESKSIAEGSAIVKGGLPLSEVITERTLVFENCFINLFRKEKKSCCKTQFCVEGSMVQIMELLKKHPFTHLQFIDCIFSHHYLRDLSVLAFRFMASQLKDSRIDTLTVLDPACKISKETTIDFSERIRSVTRLRRLTYDAGTHATIALCQAIRNMSEGFEFINPRMETPERFHTEDAMKIKERNAWYTNRYNRDWEGATFEVEKSGDTYHYEADADISVGKNEQSKSKSVHFEYKAPVLPGIPMAAEKENSLSKAISSSYVSPVSSAVKPEKPLRIDVSA